MLCAQKDESSIRIISLVFLHVRQGSLAPTSLHRRLGVSYARNGHQARKRLAASAVCEAVTQASLRLGSSPLHLEHVEGTKSQDL